MGGSSRTSTASTRAPAGPSRHHATIRSTSSGSPSNAASTSSGSYVVYSQDWHPPSTPHFAAQGGTWPIHCVMGTWGAAFHPDLEVTGDVVHKGDQGADGYSAFSERDPLSGATA